MTATRTFLTLLLTLAATATLTGCSDDPEAPAAAESEGGEDTNVLEDAKDKADEVHGRVKEEIKPAAEFVDDKTRAVVDEGKKLVGAEGEDAPAEEGEGGEAEPQ